MMNWAPWVIAVIGLGIVAYGLAMQRAHPPRVTGMATIDVTNSRTGRRMTLRTRTVEGGGFTKTEVELPGGTWIECGRSCRDTLRRETVDFWAGRERFNGGADGPGYLHFRR